MRVGGKFCPSGLIRPATKCEKRDTGRTYGAARLLSDEPVDAREDGENKILFYSCGGLESSPAARLIGPTKNGTRRFCAVSRERSIRNYPYRSSVRTLCGGELAGARTDVPSWVGTWAGVRAGVWLAKSG